MAFPFAFRVVLMVAATLGSAAASGRACADETKAAQQGRYRDAHQAMARKDWAAARELLAALWAESPTYDVASSLAQVEYQLGDYAAAAQLMAFALEHVAPVEDAPTVERMRRGMMELRGKVGGLRLRVANPSAQVLLDERVVEPRLLGTEQFVVPGRHTIEARAAGSLTARQVLDVMAGQTYTVELELQPTPAGPPLVASSHASPPRVAVASSLPPDDSSGAQQPWWPVLVGGSVTALGLGMAIGFGLAANEAEADWRGLQRTISPSGCSERPVADGCTQLRRTIDRQQSAATWSTVGVGVGVVSAVATAAYLLLWPTQRRTSAAALAPSLAASTHAAELGLSGTF